MSRQRDYADFLQDILEAIERAERFTEGMDFSQFSSDEKTVYAVVRALEIVGEAAKRVPRSVQRKNPEVPWRQMAGIRDKLVHDYFGVNLEVVWNTVHQDLPGLKRLVTKLVEDIGPGPREDFY